MLDRTINDDKTIAGGIGTMLAGRYHILRQLGEGGMGSVWLAEDRQLDNRKVAIKMLPSIVVTDKRAYQQLKSEALVSLKLVHPNIVTLRTFEENYGNPFLVMDYIEGQTLSDYLAEKGKLSENETIKLLKPIAAALDYAHGEKVIHRDVKPSNIIIRKDGHPFIFDFGIAREIQESVTRVTGRTISGTLLYMSPEQLRGASPSVAQDIYSFSVMVYECLNGDPPFIRGEIAFQIVNEYPVPLKCSPQLFATVMAGLAKRPQERPLTCIGVLEYDEPCLNDSFDDVAVQTQQAIKAYQNRDYIRAFVVAQKADKNNSEIQNILGHCFAKGYGCVKDEIEAVHWFRKAVAQDHPWAQYNFGVMYANGWGLKKDDLEAVKWLRKAAEHEIAVAQYNLGVMIANGRGVAKNVMEAIKWYRKAADQGLAVAQCELGMTYENGNGIAKDEVEAAWWFCRAAEQGYAIAQNRLGTMYEEGCGVTKDYAKAVKLYQQAAEQGLSYAQYNLSKMYVNGCGVDKDDVADVEWCLKAAEQGLVEAQFRIGWMYEDDNNIMKNNAEAMKWYRKAAEQGYDLAQFTLGTMYEDGRGVTKDIVEAVKWYRKAAEQGDEIAQSYLGMMYENGRGVTKNVNEAAEWYGKAANQGLASAQCNLGVLYANGLGVEQDDKVAVMYFRMAADQNLALAQYNLGVMFVKGRGVHKDDVEAVSWFRKAAEQGHKGAQEALDKKGLSW